MLSDSLERARTCTRASIQDVLLAEMVDSCHHASKQAPSHVRLDEVFRLYTDFWGGSLFKMPIDNTIQLAKEVVHPGSRLKHEGSWKCSYIPEKAMETRYSKLHHLRESAGLCLRCVRSGNTDMEFPCKLKH